ncbi:hypothetical protein K466DRAFT_499513 [Polyporus arcularius HHB13444]|uniref:Uncharacterized protein n=1 Tax=Polyporus arcularius HHB13444 TaxID=1314778 RepID=A0A5C3P206_9APHY|nr:hypothetical protein K466DRAFT_499513 [Polyporus arcularius HHB13444]
MFVPGISNRDDNKKLYRRKGGGGGGKGGGGGGKSSGSSGSGSSGSSGSVGSRGSSVSVPGATAGRSSAVSYGSGTTKVVSIPQGQPFAGRQSGGATRGSIYGNQQYGSGYPGVSGLGTSGRNFPFVFWPLVWGGGLGYGAAYLHNTNEYGEPNNSSRPGGPMTQAAFYSNTTNSTFHVVADNTTVVALIASISSNCSFASNSSQTPSAFSGAATDPLPEQAIQYYRASSVVLTLDGYNDTAALTGDANATAPPLPSTVDQSLLNCLNGTIGEAVPLIEDSAARMSVSSLGAVGFVYVLWCLSSFF